LILNLVGGIIGGLCMLYTVIYNIRIQFYIFIYDNAEFYAFDGCFFL
jgi:hypothetical protein